MSQGPEHVLRLERELRRLRYELSQATQTLPHLRRMVESSGDPLLLVDRELRVLLSNSRLAALLAVSDEEMHRQSLDRWVAIPQQLEVLRQRLQALDVGSPLRMELELRTADGQRLPVELEAARLAPGQGAQAEACWTLALRDISERRRLASSQAMLEVQHQLCADLSRSEERYRQLVDQLEDGLGVLDGQLHIVFANPALRRLLNLPPTDALPHSLIDSLLPADRDSFGLLAGALLAGLPRRARLRVDDAEGGWRLLELQVLPRDHGDAAARDFTLMARDVSELQQARDRLERLAFADALTGLGNAQSSLRWLAEQLEQQPDRPVAVLALDLDGFRRLNHCFGRPIGDQLLLQVAGCLRRHCRPGDWLARLGADEFLVIRSGADRAAALALAEGLQQALLAGLRLPNGERLALGVCVGLSLSPLHGSEAENLLGRAATALSQAKAGGLSRVVVYEPALTSGLVQELELERRLRQALEQDRLHLVYQPQVDADGRLLASEALLRWHDPERGPISPAEFIPVAERSGLIHQLGQWVLERVCTQLGLWRAAGLAPCPVAVNVSPQQLLVAPTMAALVAAALRRHNLPAELVELEITESSLLPVTAVADQLEELADLGVSLALDDFGTGFSSLESLHRLPLQRVKVDKSFVLQLDTSRSAQVIVGTAAAMARGLGLSCVVEGVETAEQLALLQSMDCQIFQGFHFARPLAPEAFEAVLRRGRLAI